MLRVGIDPGQSGGIALIRSRKDNPVLFKMPKSRRELLRLLRKVKEADSDVLAVIEKVTGTVGGAARQLGTAKFMRGYGELLMGLEAADIEFEETLAPVWQSALAITPRHKHKEGRKTIYDETETQWKNRLRDIARKLYPGVTIILAVSDALLIAEFCRRRYPARK